MMLADIILGSTVLLDRDVPGMLRRLGGRLNIPKQPLKIKAPPYLNSTPPLHEGGDGAKFNTVMGFTQTDCKVDGKDVKVRWKNGQAGRRGVVAIAGSQADREGQGGKLLAFHSVRWTGGPPVQPLH
eukprot:COSAG02_NODE_2251_length_9362_cov_19.062075_5_plen_127_part_00